MNADATSDGTPPETEADTETERGGVLPEVQTELERRLSRRRRNGEDIGPALERMILDDVKRDLAIPDPTVCSHCSGRFYPGSGWVHRAGCTASKESA